MWRTPVIALLFLACSVPAHAQYLRTSLSASGSLPDEADIASDYADAALPEIVLPPEPAGIGGALPPSASLPAESSSLPPLAVKAALPVESVARKPETRPPVDWKGLTRDSLRFLGVMHAFRSATEPGTRAAFSTPWFKGWFNAAGNLHGFADGDPFGVNYIGHPMQGAVSGYIWSNHDQAYKDVYFSRDCQYWKQKLRAAAFSYVNSVQFEIGPLSEASLGNVQSYYPEQGFADHIVTPVVGTGWSIGEDVLDRYLIRSIESRTDSRFWRIMARSVLNPAHAFANLMGGRYPWYRSNRPVPSAGDSATYFNAAPVPKPDPPPGVAPFEFHAAGLFKTYLGTGSRGSCVGGGAGVGFRIAREWQIVTEVDGCKMTDLPLSARFGSFADASGDSLTYVVGPRWSSQRSQRWTAHAQFLIGGNKITQEYVDPEMKRLTDLSVQANNTWPPPYSDFARSWDNNAFALVTGAGVDMRFNRALTLRVALDYSHTWNRNLNDINYRNSLQLKSGLVLNMGTW